MDVALHVILYNNRKELPELLDSLAKISYPNLIIRLLDNASTDGSREYAEEHASVWLAAKNNRNNGFGSGHNQLFRIAMDRWAGQDLSQKAILIANSDMVFAPDMVDELVRALEGDESVGSVQPKIYRMLPGDSGEAHDAVRSDMLDTTGLVFQKNWRAEDRGAGQIDAGQYDAQTDIAGPSGALALYRASALKDVVDGDEYFDDDFFLYREDCDLVLRLLRRGWKSVFAPAAKAWHYRGMYGAQGRSLLARLRDRKTQRPAVAAWSTRNQFYLLLKNLTVGDWFRALPFIVFHEAGRWLYGLVFEPVTRTTLLKSLPIWPKMLKKRARIMKKAKVSPEVIRAYVGR